MEAIAKIAKNHMLYECKLCDYSTCNNYDYNKHIKTIKHKSVSESITIADFSMVCDKNRIKTEFKCSNCNKVYKDNSGLWRHKKKCQTNKNELIETIINKQLQITPEMILNVLEQNKELTNMLVEQNKTIMELSKSNQNQIINSNVNSNNKAFNLNFFLNETCKDAMNITDFVDSIKLQFSDLEDVGRVGYIEGISNIIIKNLNALDETKRPLHCTDKKREIIYVKDQGHWEKEDDNKSKIKKLISKVSSKNSKMLSEYREKYPDCKKCDSRISDKFNKMIIEAMGGPGENNKEKEEKIIRNITKATIINK
jgi:hypothetical protein